MYGLTFVSFFAFSSDHYATVYSSPQSRVYEDVDELNTPVSSNPPPASHLTLSEKTPTASSPPQTHRHNGNGGMPRSSSTATLTSGESEAGGEPTYAVPMVVARGRGQVIVAPPVPPKGPYSASEVERFITPPAVTVTPQNPTFNDVSLPSNSFKIGSHLPMFSPASNKSIEMGS